MSAVLSRGTLRPNKLADGSEVGRVEKETIFYPLRGGISVTDRRLRVHGRIFEVRSLTNLTTEPMPAQVARRVANRIMLAEAVPVICIVALTRTLVAVISVVVYVVAAAIAIRLSIWRWPRPLQLSADYRGKRVVLYVSTDHTEFGKVCRGVRRATERHTKQI
jgi:hypothetical protein